MHIGGGHVHADDEEAKPESPSPNSSTMKNSPPAAAAAAAVKPWNCGGSGSNVFVGRGSQITVALVGLLVLGVFLLNSVSPVGLPAISGVKCRDKIHSHSFLFGGKGDSPKMRETFFSEYCHSLLPNTDIPLQYSFLRQMDRNFRKGRKGSTINHQWENTVNVSKLDRVLRRASMEDKTVILATLNDAWIEAGSVFDLFLESFRIGNNTQKLLNHLVLITWDQKAYNRCLAIHPHCYQMETKGEGDYANDAFFMTPNYLHMMWRRTEFLSSVLQMGYNFVFTDLDIMWLRDPFLRFYKDADFQIACDQFNGYPSDTRNMPNGGFLYVKSNPRTIEFYKLWINSRIVYPKLNEQDVLNKIKTHLFVYRANMKIRFLDTAYFGGFCQISKDFNKVCTMHANCCVGLDNKINDLKILLDDWRKYMALPPDEKQHSHPSWSVPRSCRTSFQRGNGKQ